MKLKSYLTTFFLLISIIAFGKVNKTKLATEVPGNDIKYLDTNEISMSVRNNGMFADVNYQNLNPVSGLSYKNIQFIYTSGLWLAAKVDTSILASAAAFFSDFTPGAIRSDGLHYGENDSVLFRVYKINRGDTPETNPNYADWPAQLGAPVDENGNPKIFGDQTLWCSFSDAYLPEREFNLPPALNAEVHLTAWGWQDIKNVVFLRWEVINKSDKTWKDAYLGFYVDPDVADASDDLVGSDSTLNLVYTYENLENPYFRSMQSIGYVFLQTPLEFSSGDTAISWNGKIPNYKNVPAASPLAYKHSPWEWTDIAFVTDSTSQLIYSRLNCIDNYGNPMLNPVTGKRTFWSLSGDPITGTGWLDPLPQDRRMMLSSGPFDLAPGDTNSAVLAIVPIVENHNKTCIYNLKQLSLALQSFFREGAGFYSERILANAGARQVAFPVLCLNSEKVKSVNFQIEALLEDIEFNSAIVGSRGKNCTLTTQIDTLNGNVNIFLQSNGAPIPVGKGDIIHLFFDVYPGAESGTYPIPFSKITYVDSNGQTHQAFDFVGAIEVRKLPVAVTLLSPTPGQFIDGMKIDFSWSDVPLGDSLVHKLRIVGENVQRAIADTNFVTLPVHDFIAEDNRSDTLRWYVETSGPEFTVPSADTSFLVLPSPQQLKIVKHKQTWTFPTSFENEKIIHAEIDSGLVYILSGKWNGSYDWTYEFHVGEFDNNNFQVVSTQNLTESKYFQYFQIDNNRAFFAGADKIFFYSINENRQLEFASEFFFGGDFVSFKTQGDYLYLLKGKMLSVLDVNDLSSVSLLGTVDLSDWFEPGQSVRDYLKDRMAFANNYLFLSFGNFWGIFDLADPAHPYLLNKTEVTGVASAIAVENDYAYVGSETRNWLAIFDVADKENPQLYYSEDMGFSHGYGTPCDGVTGLTVLDGFVYVKRCWLAEVCHYETGKYYLLDGYFSTGKQMIVGRNRIYTIQAEENSIEVYENRVLTSVKKENKNAPLNFALSQNYPNPFNPTTTIQFTTEKLGQIKLEIYNVLGQKVRTLIDKNLPAGWHKIVWDGKNNSGEMLGSGLYFAKLVAGDKRRVIKMVLVR